MKKIFYIILVTFVCFFGIDNVSANDTTTLDALSYVDNIKYFVDSTQINTTTVLNLSTGQQINFNFKGQLYTQIGNIVTPSIIYQRTALCMDGVGSGGWGTNSYTQDVNKMGTSIPCQFYGSVDYGYVVFYYAKIVVHGTDVRLIDNYWSVYISSSSKVQILGVEYSTNPYVMYSADDALILKTDEIISNLEQFKTSNGQLGVKIDETNQKLDETKQVLEDTKNTITDDDTSESTSEATSFFEGFDTNTHGLTSIITAPLELIGNIAGSSCSPLPLQVPFVNKTMSLPCMSTIYKKHFGSFLTIYQTITFGIVAYWVCVRIFALVKDFKNPEHDEIEVMDL